MVSAFPSEVSFNELDKEVFFSLPKCFRTTFILRITPGDGNCLWHMISISLCGNCSLTALLKNMTTVTIIILRDVFCKIIYQVLKFNNHRATDLELNKRTQEKYQEIIATAKAPNKWGNEYHLLALSTCLSINIYIYNFFESKVIENEANKTMNNLSGFHLIYESIKNKTFLESKKETIYGHYNPKAMHYTSLITKANDEVSNYLKPSINLFKDFC